MLMDTHFWSRRVLFIWNIKVTFFFSLSRVSWQLWGVDIFRNILLKEKEIKIYTTEYIKINKDKGLTEISDGSCHGLEHIWYIKDQVWCLRYCGMVWHTREIMAPLRLRSQLSGRPYIPLEGQARNGLAIIIESSCMQMLRYSSQISLLSFSWWI